MGRRQEGAPKHEMVHLSLLVRDVRDILALDPESDIEFQDSVFTDLTVDADVEQLFWVIHNLCRNAVQALQSDATNAFSRGIWRLPPKGQVACVSIVIDNNGPGMPRKA